MNIHEVRKIMQDVKRVGTLGIFDFRDGQGEVAGTIDKSTKQVEYAMQMPFNTRRFTLADELGHAVLHEGLTFHRDRPVQNARGQMQKDPEEQEADKFTYGHGNSA